MPAANPQVHIVTVIDRADFDRVMHQSAHRSMQAAHTYAEVIALPIAKAKVEPEWRHAVDYHIDSINLIGE